MEECRTLPLVGTAGKCVKDQKTNVSEIVDILVENEDFLNQLKVNSGVVGALGQPKQIPDPKEIAETLLRNHRDELQIMIENSISSKIENGTISIGNTEILEEKTIIINSLRDNYEFNEIVEGDETILIQSAIDCDVYVKKGGDSNADALLYFQGDGPKVDVGWLPPRGGLNGRLAIVAGKPIKFFIEPKSKNVPQRVHLHFSLSCN